MTAEARIARALAFLDGEADRVTPCGKHPDGHRQVVGDQPYEDLVHIASILREGTEEEVDPAITARRAGLKYVNAVVEVALRMKAGNADIHGGLSAEIAAEEEFKHELALIVKAAGR